MPLKTSRGGCSACSERVFALQRGGKTHIPAFFIPDEVCLGTAGRRERSQRTRSAFQVSRNYGEDRYKLYIKNVFKK